MSLFTKFILQQNLKYPSSPLVRKTLVFFIIILIGFNLAGFAQVKKEQPSWWVGVAGGANYNAYRGYITALNGDITASPAFGRGHGFGGYVAGVIEYHRPGSLWGIMLQQGVDSRRADFEKSGRKLDAKIIYFSFEPSLVIFLPKTNFYFYGGPRVGFLLNSRFTYQEPNGPLYPQAGKNYEAYIKNIKKNPIAAQVGVGYDHKVKASFFGEQIIVSPFITYLPSLDQNLRTYETLKLNTLRAGVVFKGGGFFKNN